MRGIRLAVLAALLGMAMTWVAGASGLAGNLVPMPGEAATPALAEVLERLGVDLPPSGVVAAACCKKCSKGKACGDSCISRDKRCTKGQGCACD